MQNYRVWFLLCRGLHSSTIDVSDPPQGQYFLFNPFPMCLSLFLKISFLIPGFSFQLISCSSILIFYSKGSYRTIIFPLIYLIILVHFWVLSFCVSLSGSSLCHRALSFQLPGVASLLSTSLHIQILLSFFFPWLWFLSRSFNFCATWIQPTGHWKQKRE